MDFKCDELILGKKDADSRALTPHQRWLDLASGQWQAADKPVANPLYRSERRWVILAVLPAWLTLPLNWQNILVNRKRP